MMTIDKHPDRDTLKYIDAKISQHKARSIRPGTTESEHLDHKAAAMALGILRGDIFALLHRPSPAMAVCEHPADKQVSDSLQNVGKTIRCQVCGEHRAVSDNADCIAPPLVIDPAKLA